MGTPTPEQIGARLRAARKAAGLSQRELAARLGVSASLISQVETGQSRPSVSTLYGMVNELGLSLDMLFDGTSPGAATALPKAGVAPSASAVSSGPPPVPAGSVVGPEDRHVIELETGVRWERLTAHSSPGVDFLAVVYEPGGASSRDGQLMRHNGQEYGYIVSGRLGVQIAFDTYELGPGDAISFDSAQPHRLWAIGDEPVHGIWFVIGR